MKTLKSILLSVCFLFMLPLSSQAQEVESYLIDMTTYTVKFGHDANFTDGVKKWIKCYKDNNGKGTWNTWHRLQGNSNEYVVVTRKDNWAAMDESDPVGKMCSPIAMQSIVPHIESVEIGIGKYMPNYSKNSALEDNTIVWVTNFEVKDDTAFNEVVKQVTETIASKEGQKRGYWYSILGGEGADYFVSSAFKNFADLDNDRDGVWKVYESVHGKPKTKEIRDKFRASVEDIWSYLYTLESDLSK